MTQFPDLFAALAAPFADHEVKSRTQAGRTLHYITARTAMNRLDDVLGPENWWDRFTPGEHSVLCELTIRLPDGSTLTKADAGGYAGMPDEGDDDKSGFSDSYKRACVKFGVGRYLYRDGVPAFARPPESIGDGERRRAEARDAPARREAPTPDRDRVGSPPPSSPSDPKAPRSGRAFFAWVREQEQKHEIILLKYLNSWAKLNEFPGRMVDWSPEQVEKGHAEALRKLEAIPGDAAA